ncbi:MAG: alpha/beta hydrolase [Crocinitomicaceae bacterium]
MKKITLLTLLITVVQFSVISQAPEIGHTTITFNDPSRTGGFGSGGGAGRQIQSEIYYPADLAGEDVPLSNGQFPVIVFGHGFVMAWDAYENLWEELIPQGYIMVFPRTEGGFSPSHQEFALDLALLVDKMQTLNTTTSSLFENKVANKTAIMGHSMGGGASILAASNNTTIETVIGLAPAETTPSAISAATTISVPALIFSGSEDAVTPPADHHQPIYQDLGSSCKYFVSITGGAHCYFANSNFNCDFGEGTSGGNISVTREEQHLTTFQFLNDWLAFKLKSDCNSFVDFQNNLNSNTDITFEDDCNLSTPSITSSTTDFCVGETASITASETLDWNTGSTGTSIIVDTSGTYYGTTSDCSSSNSVTINFHPSDSINQEITICQGETITVGSNSYSSPGTYYDDFTSVNGCDSVVITQLSVTTSLDNTINITSTELIANQTGVSYQWIDCDNSNAPISGATQQNFIPLDSGNYAVIIGDGSCSVTSDCVYFEQTSSSISNLNFNIEIYPNPAGQFIHVDLMNSASYQLLNLRGEELQSGWLSAAKNTLQLDYPNGIYMLKFTSESGATYIQKFIINL